MKRHSPTTPAPKELTAGELFELEAWALSKPEHAWAGPHVEELAEACLDHFRGTGEHRADWLATIRTWIRRTPAYSVRTFAGSHQPHRRDFAAERVDATKNAARDALRSMAARRGLKVIP